MKISYSKTKIVATFGPATSKKSVLIDMIKSGVDIFRFNFSHGSYQDHLNGMDLIREINKENDINIGILADLQGPKIRVGEVKDNGVMLKNDSVVEITQEEILSNEERIYVSYDNLHKDVEPGERILMDDGKLELKVTEVKGKSVFAKVVYGGKLSSRKGVNLPNTKTSIPCLTKKDRADLAFALEQDVNWIALSFVRHSKDVKELRELLPKERDYLKIISKIEKPEAVKDIDEIIEASDGIMVARGDLGVELPVERVPLIQKMIINKCLAKARPVIVATQMMESMIENSSPTRAEVTDVANAVIDGTDAVMLSGETSVGKHPAKVIQTMQKILMNVEKESDIYDREQAADKKSPTYVSDAVCYNAAYMSQDLKAKAIIGMTKSGYTAFLTSSVRPRADIYIFTETRQLMATLNLIWGVRCFYYDKFVSTDVTIRDVIRILKKNKLATKGDIVINIGSMPLRSRGRTNMTKVTVVS